MKSAEAQMVLLSVLLKDNAKRSKAIIANYKPPFASMQEYFDFVDSITLDKDTVLYKDENIAVLEY